MTDITDNIDPNLEEEKKKKTEGEGESGKGRAGGEGRAGSGGAPRIPVHITKAVLETWKYLNANESIGRVVEFFSELPARASANMMVTFDSVTKQGYAVVNQVITFGQDVISLMRARTREGAVQNRRKQKFVRRIGPPDPKLNPTS